MHGDATLVPALYEMSRLEGCDFLFRNCYNTNTEKREAFMLGTVGNKVKRMHHL
jgi:hypothetical protein